MFDSRLERLLTYRLGAAIDCWGRKRLVRRGSRGGVWFLDPTQLDTPEASGAGPDRDMARRAALNELRQSGCLTETELATLNGLVAEKLTLEEIAARDGCTRQAVVARLVGNSRGQGGVVKKARRLLGRVTP
jgi:hypothetical protein